MSTLHDYSTSRTGAVPDDRRRSRRHFMSLWITLTTGFTYLFLGFEFHESGYSFFRAIGVGAVGGAIYVAFALPSAYLGSVSGLTFGLLTRSALGRVGSALTSIILIVIPAGWTAFAFNMLAQIYHGLFGWGFIISLSVVLTVIGIANNLFGFSGITAYARYLVVPVLLIWIAYLVIKGLASTPEHMFTGKPAGMQLPFLAGVGTAIGSITWGNEADTWRYGKPKFWWPLPVFVVAVVIGLIVFVAGGWLMAALSGFGSTDFGPAFRYIVGYSMFGLLWLGAILATVFQIAINDGNYYEMVNAGQNLVGQVRWWPRWGTCLVMAAIAALFAWQFPSVEDGFFAVTGWSSLALPCVTVVLCADRFLLGPLLGVHRGGNDVPSWRTTPLANWLGIIAVLASVGWGAWRLGLFPGQTANPVAALPAVESWAVALVLYVGLAALAVRFGIGAAMMGLPRQADRAS